MSPASNATGVASNAVIVITFSEPMNKLATQAAYQSADIPASTAVLTWDTTGKVLTVTPDSPLEYAAGTALAAAAKSYTFLVTNTATDLAGNELTTFSSHFTTLRQLSLQYSSVVGMDGYVRADGATTTCVVFDPGNATYSFIDNDYSYLICAGDSSTAANAQYKGFVTFDLTGLPVGITSFLDASVMLYQVFDLGSPCANLGALDIDHVTYAALDTTAFNATALSQLGTFADDLMLEYKSATVTAAVTDDYANRAARSSRSQYRLTFGVASNFDGVADTAIFLNAKATTSAPVLNTTFLVP